MSSSNPSIVKRSREMSLETSRVFLKGVMDGVRAGRKPVEPNSMFPLHAQLESFPYGGNAHYAVCCALGKGLGPKKPVGRHRPFFKELLASGLIDRDGNASVALQDEIQVRETLEEMALFDAELDAAVETESVVATAVDTGDDGFDIALPM